MCACAHVWVGVCVFVCVPVGTCVMCPTAHVEVRGLPQLLVFTVHLALMQSPAVPCCVDQGSWPMSFWEFSSFHFPCHRSDGIIDTTVSLSFIGLFLMWVLGIQTLVSMSTESALFHEHLVSTRNHSYCTELICAKRQQSPALVMEICVRIGVWLLREPTPKPELCKHLRGSWKTTEDFHNIILDLYGEANKTKPPNCWASNASNRKWLIKPRFELKDEFKKGSEHMGSQQMEREGKGASFLIYVFAMKMSFWLKQPPRRTELSRKWNVPSKAT